MNWFKNTMKLNKKTSHTKKIIIRSIKLSLTKKSIVEKVLHFHMDDQYYRIVRCSHSLWHLISMNWKWNFELCSVLWSGNTCSNHFTRYRWKKTKKTRTTTQFIHGITIFLSLANDQRWRWTITVNHILDIWNKNTQWTYLMYDLEIVLEMLSRSSNHYVY